ncbi:uncharacterized protein TRIADDRAFT_57664 [Trichoplax adhaerens]|uniref:Uncharacterized protein n=1 Tax=Trichoplax adhaerens TaxID=10228 RepID=B3S029_TRIAD|nr:predicted protein [Trichoplax adhaerens]EDV24317.1 predicted protein [Trichoplax adhaerens]|eukprot:XP_002113843.1 predicted protein [Trichoplax adhaerens]
MPTQKPFYRLQASFRCTLKGGSEKSFMTSSIQHNRGNCSRCRNSTVIKGCLNASLRNRYGYSKGSSHGSIAGKCLPYDINYTIYDKSVNAIAVEYYLRMGLMLYRDVVL